MKIQKNKNTNDPIDDFLEEKLIMDGLPKEVADKLKPKLKTELKKP